jgi:hypothetical protein
MMSQRLVGRPGSWTLPVMALFCVGSFALSASRAKAENRCSATVTRSGKRFDLSNCSVAYSSSEHSVMIWFTENALSSGEEKSFQGSAFAPERDIHGKYLTMMSLQFCPGGGSSTPNPGDVKSVKVRIHTADTKLLAHWVSDASAGKDVRAEKMQGDLRPGGKLSGRMTGNASSWGTSYSWVADFDLRLPNESSTAGMNGCDARD